MEKRIELGKEIFTGFNENSFSDSDWKLYWYPGKLAFENIYSRVHFCYNDRG